MSSKVGKAKAMKIRPPKGTQALPKRAVQKQIKSHVEDVADVENLLAMLAEFIVLSLYTYPEAYNDKGTIESMSDHTPAERITAVRMTLFRWFAHLTAHVPLHMDIPVPLYSVLAPLVNRNVKYYNDDTIVRITYKIPSAWFTQDDGSEVARELFGRDGFFVKKYSWKVYSALTAVKDGKLAPCKFVVGSKKEGQAPKLGQVSYNPEACGFVCVEDMVRGKPRENALLADIDYFLASVYPAVFLPEAQVICDAQSRPRVAHLDSFRESAQILWYMCCSGSPDAALGVGAYTRTVYESMRLGLVATLAQLAYIASPDFLQSNRAAPILDQRFWVDMFLLGTVAQNPYSAHTQNLHTQADAMCDLIYKMKTSQFENTQVPNFISESICIQKPDCFLYRLDGSVNTFAMAVPYYDATQISRLKAILNVSSAAVEIKLAEYKSVSDTTMDQSDHQFSAPLLSTDLTLNLTPRLMVTLQTKEMVSEPIPSASSFLTLALRQHIADVLPVCTADELGTRVGQEYFHLSGTGAPSAPVTRDEFPDDMSQVPPVGSWAERIVSFLEPLKGLQISKHYLLSHAKRDYNKKNFDELYHVLVPSRAGDVQVLGEPADALNTNLLAVGFNQVSSTNTQQLWKSAKAQVGSPNEIHTRHSSVVQSALTQVGGFGSLLGGLLTPVVSGIAGAIGGDGAAQTAASICGMVSQGADMAMTMFGL